MESTAPPLTSLITHLLPLQGIEITLRFLSPVRLQFFHHPVLTAFLRSLLRSPEHYDLYFTLDAPESGRTHYRQGDRYRFVLFILAGGEALFEGLLRQLQALPAAAERTDSALPLRDNLAFCEARDLFTERVVRTSEDAPGYTLESLTQEADSWGKRQFVRLRWRSPVRLLLDKAQRETKKGEARYCHHPHEVSFGLLANRLHDTFADLLRRRGHVVPPRGPAPSVNISLSDLFWIDCRYRDGKGHEQVMGGLMGIVDLTHLEGIEAWSLWVLGQYLGVGQRRVFGWGRYRLESASGEHTFVHSAPVTSLLEQVAHPDNLVEAFRIMRANQARRIPWLTDEDEWAWTETDPWDDDPNDEEYVTDRLDRLAERLAAGRYEPPPLKGVIVREEEGDLRPLAIPPFFDRVAQRAVAQILTPGLEPLMYHGSFGYRPRRSRKTARKMIQEAYAEGYRWVYESDIDDFFDSVDWTRLHTRLVALYGEDPLVALILHWMGAPVEYENQHIERGAGLPQGSPLSPLLANLMLDDFDHDLDNANFRLARFADDFVILCKNRDQAEAAAQATVSSLAELGLKINQDKTEIRSFNQGFRYLGYLFVNSLALDISGQKGEEQASHTSAAPPPKSWLAKLHKREPQLLDAEGQLQRRPSESTTSVLATPKTVTRLGGQSPEGTMLFVTGTLTMLSTRRGRLMLERDGQLLTSVPWHSLQGVVLLGPHHITVPSLRMAMSRGVPVHFATQDGRYLGVTWNGQPGAEGHQLWLQQQACFSDPDQALAAARAVVEARLRHMREVLRQRTVDEVFLGRIDDALRGLRQASTLNVLHGLEGQGTRAFFDALKGIVPATFGFGGRNRRPPRDPFNALLSLGYTMLYAHVQTVIRASGLLPWVGFYHQGHGRHATLASDLMEPFRHLVERTALTAVTRGRLKPDAFYLDSTQGCRLNQDARRYYLAILTERFDRPITALYDEQPKTLHDHLHNQNRSLISWIRGDVAEFKAWRSR